MIHRSVNLSKAQSFFLFGARGTGKSTLLRKEFPPDKYFWVDLLHPEQEMRYATRPERLLEDWRQLRSANKQHGWVIIDEVQRLPKLLDIAHIGIEEHGIKFAMTGSSTVKLRRGAANLLAGRAITFNLYPFSALELGADFELEDALNFGTLPRSFALRHDSKERRRFLASYVNTYLREEIQAEQLARRLEPFRYFLEAAAAASGTILNVAKLSRQAHIEPRTAQRYFALLEDTMIGFYLPAFERSVRRRQAKHQKFYFFDTGVVRAATQSLKANIIDGTYEFGRLFEQWVIIEIVKANTYSESDYQLSYLKTADGSEIDLIAARGEKTLAIEIKSTADPDITAVRRLARLARGISMCQPYIFCRTSIATEIEGVKVLPWQQGIAELFA
ncbi:MAG: DUF4143 domain-containing protein [Pseudomonadota bacterium]|nr:DUF4143 domain-containing protein [Pseudomonadota bacterium]